MIIFHRQGETSMSEFSKSMFEPLVGQSFILHTHDGDRIALKLTRIEEFHHIKNYESFCLNFDVPCKEPALPDDSYVVQNDQLGEKTLFLSATPTPDPDPNTYYYESNFNVFLKDG
jgi:hypothetical protein